MSDVDLDALQKLYDAATPGPWTFYLDNLWNGVTADELAASDANPEDDDLWCNPDGTDRDLSAISAGDVNPPDARFIADFHTAFPALIARIRELEATSQRLRADCNRLETENAELQYQLGLAESRNGLGGLRQVGEPFGTESTE